MKKFLSVILALAMVISICTVTASAEEGCAKHIDSTSGEQIKVGASYSLVGWFVSDTGADTYLYKIDEGEWTAAEHIEKAARADVDAAITTPGGYSLTANDQPGFSLTIDGTKTVAADLTIALKVACKTKGGETIEILSKNVLVSNKKELAADSLAPTYAYDFEEDYITDGYKLSTKYSEGNTFKEIWTAVDGAGQNNSAFKVSGENKYLQITGFVQLTNDLRWKHGYMFSTDIAGTNPNFCGLLFNNAAERDGYPLYENNGVAADGDSLVGDSGIGVTLRSADTIEIYVITYNEASNKLGAIRQQFKLDGVNLNNFNTISVYDDETTNSFYVMINYVPVGVVAYDDADYYTASTSAYCSKFWQSAKILSASGEVLKSTDSALISTTKTIGFGTRAATLSIDNIEIFPYIEMSDFRVSLDAVKVNDVTQPKAGGGLNKIATADITMNEGDAVTMIGWVLTNAGMTYLDYSVVDADGNTVIDWTDITTDYRARDDVLNAFKGEGWEAGLNTTPGFGLDAAYSKLPELSTLEAGTYMVYVDANSQFESYITILEFTLTVNSTTAVDPDYHLMADGAGYGVGYWMHPAATGRYIEFTFTTPSCFNGFSTFIFATGKDSGGCQAKLELYSEGILLETIDLDCQGDSVQAADFSRTYPEGKYAIRIVGNDENKQGVYIVLAWADKDDSKDTTVTAVCDSNDASKVPYFTLKGAEHTTESAIAVADSAMKSCDRVYVNTDTLSGDGVAASSDFVYDVTIEAGDTVNLLGWIWPGEGIAVTNMYYTVDGGAYLATDDSLRARPDVDGAINKAGSTGIGKDDDCLTLNGIGSVAGGKHTVKVYAYSNGTMYNYITINLTVKASASVKTDKDSYKQGAEITVTADGAKNANDWLGIYAASVTDYQNAAGGSIDWAYLNGEKTAPDAAVTDGATVKFTLTDTVFAPGDYQVVLLENDGYTVLAKATFTVTGATADEAETVGKYVDATKAVKGETETDYTSGTAFEKGTYDAIKLIGWYGANYAVESFGYRIGDGEAVYGEWAEDVDASDPVRAAGNGGDLAKRFEIPADISALAAGKYTVTYLAKLADGSVMDISAVEIEITETPVTPPPTGSAAAIIVAVAVMAIGAGIVVSKKRIAD